jgi:hypothetical protein
MLIPPDAMLMPSSPTHTTVQHPTPHCSLIPSSLFLFSAFPHSGAGGPLRPQARRHGSPPGGPAEDDGQQVECLLQLAGWQAAAEYRRINGVRQHTGWTFPSAEPTYNPPILGILIHSLMSRLLLCACMHAPTSFLSMIFLFDCLTPSCWRTRLAGSLVPVTSSLCLVSLEAPE